MNTFLFGAKEKVIEYFRYDIGRPSIIFSVLIYSSSLILLKFKLFPQFVKFAGFLHASTFYGSQQLSFKLLNKFTQAVNLKRGSYEAFIESEILNYKVLETRKKFELDPTKLFKNTVIVVKSSKGENKGLIIIKYSYYFVLFLKLFNAEEVFEKYHVILEPSWAGFFNIDILAYTKFKHHVFIMCYEKRDSKLISQLNSNLVPVNIGPNWWVPPVQVDKENIEKTIDLAIVASWSKFKRHYFIFKALSKLIYVKPNLKIVLIGYNGDLSKDCILKMASDFNLSNNIEVYEKIPSHQVFELVRKSKASILWSRFEGNNRSIIESMCCNTPVIFREGHNFGDCYPYINEQTAVIANEQNLSEKIEYVLGNYKYFSPKKYVDTHHNYALATKKIESCIQFLEPNYTIGDAVYKVNYLWGMGYLNKSDNNMFDNDYSYLANTINKKQ